MLSRLWHVLALGIRVIPLLMGLTGDIILPCEQPVDLAG